MLKYNEQSNRNTPTVLNSGNKNTQTNDGLFMKQIAIVLQLQSHIILQMFFLALLAAWHCAYNKLS